MKMASSDEDFDVVDSDSSYMASSDSSSDDGLDWTVVQGRRKRKHRQLVTQSGAVDRQEEGAGERSTGDFLEAAEEVVELLDGEDTVSVDNEEGLGDEAPKTKRKKKNIVKDIRQARLEGKQFVSRSGKVHFAAMMRPNPCTGCLLKCAEVSDAVRDEAFSAYYRCKSVESQQALLGSLIVVKEPRRRRVEGSNRCAIEYYLPTPGTRRQVCEQVFRATLSLSRQNLKTMIARLRGGGEIVSTQGGSHHVVEDVKKERLRNWIKQLPAVPSHYCRKSSSKVYLPSAVKSVSNLFRKYESEVEQSVQEGLFRKILKTEFNIGVHVPRKDKCWCTTERRNEVSVQELEQHLSTKEQISRLVRSARERAERENTYKVVDFDLQKVLNTPHTDSMLVGYSRCYAFYNESFFDSTSKHGVCFLWGEMNAKRGANEVATVLYLYLEKLDEAGVKEVDLFCDSCTGQNRNRGIFSALLLMSLRFRNLKRIRLTFLLSGHTEMKVDSIHATVERCVRKATVWAPSEWPAVIRNARKTPGPYETRMLEGSQVRDFMGKPYFKSNNDEDGNKVPWGSIRIFQVDDGQATYSTRASNDRMIKIMFRRQNRGRPGREIELPPFVYDGPLGLAPAKYKDLMALCDKGVIPQDNRAEYRAMFPDRKVRDELDQTDEEDNDV